jgi:hypothetical protein
VAWLTMGPANNYPRIRDRFEKIGPLVKLFYHSYDAPCDGCVFEKGTSFATGRNLLLSTARVHSNIKYFVFFDDDMELRCGQSLQQVASEAAKKAGKTSFPQDSFKRCWESFGRMLLEEETTYPFIKPLSIQFDLQDAFTIKYQSCSDENFKAFHRDYLWFFFPSSTHNEHISWWFNGGSKMYLSQRCFHYAWKVDGNWGASNLKHRPYPRHGKAQKHLVQDLLQFTYPELGPWDISQYKCCHRCEVTDTPSHVSDIDPLCITTLKARYNRWLNGTFEKSLL